MNTLNAGLKPKLLMALTLLREKSDEKKFVGLLLVAKILNTECLSDISCETIVESGASSDPSFISAASPAFASASAASPLYVLQCYFCLNNFYVFVYTDSYFYTSIDVIKSRV